MDSTRAEPIAACQAGAVSLAQCLEAGLTRSAVRALLAGGRWQRVYPGVFATHTGSLEPETRVWAAWLVAGPGAVVSHQTSLWLAGGMKGPLVSPMHVSIARERIVKPPPGVVIHRLERLERGVDFRRGCQVNGL